ncbi:hypothetical protein SAMN04487911_10324 [Arenibacter nanhaiticus]|uniref:GH25 family protein n=1 Tax=Arenibacter nanhaiticus TaxID=558155 RepID=A0A1M6BZI1_9FLAO|nr:hypothetical protein [Arenibacter nanhaiticus]SHI53884.1 hypothetical protein SAMN04487911_10324 [Arenibacter nanhaiticus]
MSSINRIVFFALFLTWGQNLFAHALWIQTKAQAEVNKEHEITIFYAEPNDEREIIVNWWSDTSNFTLWLTLPNGTRKQLDVKKDEDSFSSSFTPLVIGDYKLSISHNVAQLVGDTQYQFNASASVKVGTLKSPSSFDTNFTKDELFIDYKIAKKGKQSEVSIFVHDGNEPIAKNKVTVFAPNGWQKAIETNEHGMSTFDAKWPGVYFLEGFKTEEVSNNDITKKIRVITLLVDLPE